MKLPPGQRRIEGFPRFGTHLHHPPPVVPADPVLQIRGAGDRPFTVPLAALADLPRRELDADFHCVAGWSATGLRWEGVPFEAFYRLVIAPSIEPGTPVTHVVFGGLDGHQAALTIEDALADDVLIAERLNGRALGADHGAPARLVSPNQYGYLSTKHLCEIELRTADPGKALGAASRISEVGMRGPLVLRHPRARVWQEERHPYLPAPLLRPFYRLTIRAGVFVSAPRRWGEKRRERTKLPESAHSSRPWRIHELTRDFRLEDVWALPTPGGPDDFPRLVDLAAALDPSRSSSRAVRALFAIRWKAGELLGWDEPETGLGSRVPTLHDRLPADLREGPRGPASGSLPFTPLYLTGDEWAAEVANRTVHAVLHLGWVPDEGGGHRGQMAVYVKRNGLLGAAYMAAIAPFRHRLVYPPMLREIGRAWRS